VLIVTKGTLYLANIGNKDYPRAWVLAIAIAIVGDGNRKHSGSIG
jgi:hypothetical protein